MGSPPLDPPRDYAGEFAEIIDGGIPQQEEA
jgi:hypothetical protein